MSAADVRLHEVAFCARVKSWAEALLKAAPASPFERVEIEEATGPRRQRSDLRVYDRHGKLVLAGEVKLPGTPEGRSPHQAALVEEAFDKASRAGAEFFFTWNVNVLVLFDAKLWHQPIEERRVNEFALGLRLEQREELDRPEVEQRLREFLAGFLAELAEIVSGRKPDWGLAPDQYFIRAFESHIDWPVRLTAAYLYDQAAADPGFDARLQEWMAQEQGWSVVRGDPHEWRTLLDRAARTLCYVFANRMLFYESVRAKFTGLEALSVPARGASAPGLYAHFQRAFQEAVVATGDYETLFYPLEQDEDWAGPLIFGHAGAADAWRAVLANLAPFNFRELRTDILGGIFKRLIAPEERHKFGQHYTSEDLVDVVNAFCLRHGDARVLDPACGSGSFLVRAYHRKAWLDNSRPHQALLGDIFGADLALFAAHLSTLNLAARDLRDEENYPRVQRGNFFALAKGVHARQPFCRVPRALREADGRRELEDVFLPPLDAIVGNPPYVRQELIPRRGDKGVKRMQSKEDLAEFIATVWPGLRLSGRSDLHCYFWPAAAWRLKEGGWFGFLVSSSWLDVEYGFGLQAWVLGHFRIVAVLESQAEPWFADARVKTCAVILQRCADTPARLENLVRFVRLDVPLGELLGRREDETTRQNAAERFRRTVLDCRETQTRKGFRVVVKGQRELWEEGLRAGRLFALQKQRELAEGGAARPEAPEPNGAFDEGGNGYLYEAPAPYGAGYGGGKWGKYLRAPDLYFRILREHGRRFVPLGELATIRFGVKSGCDAFFMPREVTGAYLAKYTKSTWPNAPLYTACKRSEVESGEVRLIEAGDGTVHPVEAKYLAPEVHSLMDVKRPILRAEELDRLILLVSEPLDRLKGTHVAKYLRYGEKHSFASGKSKPVPVPKRSTCAGRELWYDLTYTKHGHLVWPKSQQYRHVVLYNQHRLLVNCNLYDVRVVDEATCPPDLLAAVLNGTLVAMVKTYFGRYAGTEGNLKTEVVDVNLLEVPDPRQAAPAVAAKLREAFARLCQRDTRGLVEDEFMACRSPERAAKLARKPLGLPSELCQPDRRDLDLAVFELLGVKTASERERLCDELYHEVTAHFRRIRIVEIQKQEQRGKTANRQFRTDELAADLWDALAPETQEPLAQWVARAVGPRAPLTVTVPEGTPSLPDPADLFAASQVYFHQGKAGHKQLALPSRAHAELVHWLAGQGLHGPLGLPAAGAEAASLLARLQDRRAALAAQAGQLARSRTGDAKRVDELSGLLEHWMLHGKPARTCVALSSEAEVSPEA